MFHFFQRHLGSVYQKYQCAAFCYFYPTFFSQFRDKNAFNFQFCDNLQEEMGGGKFSANCSRHSSVDEDRSARESINFGENCFDLSRAEITSSLSRWESFSNILCVFTRFLNLILHALCYVFFCQIHKKISGGFVDFIG